jgi:hypothetical protein
LLNGQRRPPTAHNLETTTMSLFQDAKSTTAYVKAGFFGKTGSGKTLTGSLFAMGLVQHLRKIGSPLADKPVFYFDTEGGSDFILEHFWNADIKIKQAKSDLFADCASAFDIAEREASVLLVDSITHVAQELRTSFLKKKQRSFLQIDDWNYLRGPQGWKRIQDAYVKSNLHVICCGRLADETDSYTDEDGKRQIEKTGVKMKADGDMGYEASLLVLMERPEIGRDHDVIHTAKVMKDRSMRIDGREFRFAAPDLQGKPPTKDDTAFLIRQTWAAFAPHVESLALGGKHVVIQSIGDSTHVLKTEKRDWQPVQRRIVLDEIKDLLVMHVPGQAAADKQRRVVLLKEHFSAGWVEIEETFDLLTLRAGYDSLHCELEKKPSRYAAAMEAEVVPPLADDIPDHPVPAKPVGEAGSKAPAQKASLSAEAA